MPTKSKIDSCPENVRRWYRAIGSKGGQAGKGTELRREIARRSARKRWDAVKASGGANWQKPKGKPKKKRPQAPPPKKKLITVKMPAIVTTGGSQPVIGFK